jgi:hypothetical protein
VSEVDGQSVKNLPPGPTPPPADRHYISRNPNITEDERDQARRIWRMREKT